MDENGHSPGIADAKVLDRTVPDVGARDSQSHARPPRKRIGTPAPALPRRLVSLAETSRYLSVSDWTVRQMVWRGDLPHVRLGKRILIDARDLDGWIDRAKVRGV